MSRAVTGNISGTVLRTVFAIVFCVTGFLLGRELYVNVLSLHFASEALQWTMLIVSPVAGALLGVFLAPLAQSFFEDELNLAERAMERLAPGELAGGAIGVLVGLGAALLIKSIIFEFIAGAGRAGIYIAILLYLIVAIFFAYLGARIGARTNILPFVKENGRAATAGGSKLVDTSVIVDGRIVEIVQSGFLEGPLLVPRFVLRELQTIADSEDPQRRSRGRRGLEVLAKLQELAAIEISERDFTDMLQGDVDAKLVRLAREMQARLITNDYNLNRVAHVEGVRVLNINELANAVKPVVLPGEELHVQVIREGKEPHQGVAYLDDGTMIVIEHGRRLVGSHAEIVVTSVLQTVAGRMIFARGKNASATK
jgi:uncharacterized protein YacL